MKTRFAALVALGAVGLVGCGGAEPSDLLAGDGGGASSSADGGHDSSSSSGSTGDARSDAPATDPGVHCPSSGYCPVPGEVCCRQMQGDTCVETGSCSGLAIPCDDSADCAAAGMPGAVCCLVNGPNGMAQSVECKAASECTSAQGATPLCSSNTAGSCPSGLACLPSQQSLPGFYICR